MQALFHEGDRVVVHAGLKNMEDRHGLEMRSRLRAYLGSALVCYDWALGTDDCFGKGRKDSLSESARQASKG